MVICAVLFLAVMPVYAGHGGGHGSGGRGDGYGVNSSRGYNSGHSYGRSGYRYDGHRWRRGSDFGSFTPDVNSIDSDTMDAVNARIRRLKAAAAEKANAARIQAQKQ
jgi:hypothetical protein